MFTDEWGGGLILLLVMIAGCRLADGLQRERMVGSWLWCSERTLPGKLHTASVVLPAWPVKNQTGKRSRSLSMQPARSQVVETIFCVVEQDSGRLHPPGETKMLPT